MVFNKIKDMFSQTDDKYEVLYYKYSQVRLENQKLKEKHKKQMDEHKKDVHKDIADHLISLFESVETAKNDSFKVKASDVEIQRLLMDINKVEKDMKKIMKNYLIEEIIPSERMFDPELHEVASYDDAKGMTKGMIIKTVKRGFKHRGNIVKKPRVVVTK